MHGASLEVSRFCSQGRCLFLDPDLSTQGEDLGEDNLLENVDDPFGSLTCANAVFKPFFSTLQIAMLIQDDTRSVRRYARRRWQRRSTISCRLGIASRRIRSPPRVVERFKLPRTHMQIPACPVLEGVARGGFWNLGEHSELAVPENSSSYIAKNWQ